ncbi:pleckstrin homology-like domain family B member 1 [Calliphora vicina]|uniref:pleckstrin homology-like domain family B member 1 n=1 Tax=Calliphora vicina TaxID=7373 RepID=UPI00325BEF0C
MSLSKKDPSLRVAANDPHLVSLGGGRLSTAVTIHNIPVGDCTIGSSPQCSVSLSGAGVRPIHCTIYRSEENQVTLVPERNARILIDNQLIKNEIDLRQGAMITIGDSYYLRYNNPAEALQMRSAMGDISENDYSHDLDYFYESNVNPTSKARQSDKSTYSDYDNLKKSDTSVDFMGWQCPKVFTADLVTVNMPAKDVLGQKYASFAKNLAENHRKDKNINVLNASDHIYNNITLNNSLSKSKELLNKANNTSTPLKSNDLQRNDRDPLEDMLKICTEYTDRQDRSYTGGSSSITSSPIVQNRIKTNGSLPRDKKSPFYQELQSSFQGSNSSLSQSPKSYQKSSSGYENVQLLQQNRVEIVSTNKSSGYENVRLVPQSPRTKIRTNCMSPKKEANNSIFSQDTGLEKSTTNYEDLIKSFEEKFQKEIDAIEESSRSVPNSKKSFSNNSSPAATKRTNKNINNLTIDIKSFVSPYNSPTPLKKPTPAPRKINKTKALGTGSLSNLLHHQSPHDQLHKEREDLLQRIQCLKTELSSLQKQDNETLIEMDMENALVLAELQSLTANKQKLQDEYQALQQKIHRLEAQRNATRVMEENQQSKLKYSIEMKQDQVEKLKELLKQKPDNLCLKEELLNVRESLENDKKSFEDLEFQYLEGESEWQAYREDLNSEEQTITKKIKECQLSIENLEKQEINSTISTSAKQRRLSNHLISLIKDLQQCEEQFKHLEKKLSLKISSNSSLSEQEDDQNPSNILGSQGQITQSLFGSTEMLCPKVHTEDLMSKSVNENMFYNNKIEFLSSSGLTANKAKGSKDSLDSKDVNCKMYGTIKEIERQRQLLTTQKGLRDLDYERRKIEDLLKKLNSETKQQIIPTNRKETTTTTECKPSIVHYQKQSSQKDDSLSPAYTSTPPLSAASSDPSNKLSPNVVHKSINELSISSPDSPRSFYIDDKRSSSVLSNDLSSQGDSSSISCERKKSHQPKQQRPLTRYLPIFAEDLNLKRHIESAGHPISLCPHVFLDAYSCRGYLHKLGSTFHAWSKRWFVLDRQRNALIYYADKSERKPRGGAYFSSIDEVYMDHLNVSKSSRPHSTFIVKTKKRSYYLQAASDTAARIWIDVIITGAQGNIDY